MTARSDNPPVLHETPEEVEFELRASEGAMWTGTRLLIGIVAFGFASLAFAYFYLRSADNQNLWRPGHVTASIGLGTAIFIVTLAAGALLSFGQFRLRQGSRIDWVVAGWVTVGAGLVAVLLQIWELIKLPFYPGSSGYSSCFIAWAVMNISLLLGSVYWIETLLARSIRLHRALVSEAGHTAALPPERMFMANAAGCALFWQFAAVVSAFFWLLFYII
jgi:heme/copper-type cytochrome/quinol oxidase subunit 3